jgi:hypothetical protein
VHGCVAARPSGDFPARAPWQAPNRQTASCSPQGRYCSAVSSQRRPS